VLPEGVGTRRVTVQPASSLSANISCPLNSLTHLSVTLLLLTYIQAIPRGSVVVNALSYHPGGREFETR
jgi:hypothetical protein